MSYSIPSSTKISTLTTAPFLFISVGALSVCEFAMVPGVYIFLCPQEKNVLLFPTHSAAQSSKRFKPLPLYYYGKVIDELEKNTNNELNCVYGACNLTK